MSIAVTGALLLGQWPEAAMVMVLFTIAELIEAKSLDRARNAIQGLMQLPPSAPRCCRPMARGAMWMPRRWQSMPACASNPANASPWMAASSVASSTINQAPITGESLPVDKAEGDPYLPEPSMNLARSSTW
jgi:Cd2+/Zn2+-exporting ATPase